MRPAEDLRLDAGRYPVDPWRLVETTHALTDLGVTETLFAVGNGYLGMRGNPEEGRDAYAHGTYLNGFHETWPIHHAENAFGFARTGQTIVNVPDTKVMKLYVDDEPLILGTADIEDYARILDFRDGVLRRSLVWRAPSGKRVKVETSRMVSMTQRHLAIMTMDVTMLEGSAPVVVSSQMINRQDGEDEYHERDTAMGVGFDPRKAGAFTSRVLQPQMHYARDDRMLLGYRCAGSKMTLAVAADHLFDTDADHEIVVRASEDHAKNVFRVDLPEGGTIRIVKAVAYHSSTSVPVGELSDRCDRTLDRVRRNGVEHYVAEQRAWFDRFWEDADVRVEGHPAVQQAIRFNLFQLAQASARADRQGVAAKGVTGSGYEGHYFWDTEIYVSPFLAYTQPDVARNVLHFRSRMLPSARARALELAQEGVLFPWRTINGEEASAYYAAGTAQMHINADVAYAVTKYLDATGDHGFLVSHGIDILVGTARMWADLGFWRHNDEPSFHIHGVTGPDEYTTVVNNNLFTNVMARYNLERAAEAIRHLREDDPDAYERVEHRLKVTGEEVAEWSRCARYMTIPFDERLGIHPQDDQFLQREVWDLSKTPEGLRPLLLHYHPLVIYRFQVLKQADVVLALFLQGDRFTAECKKADFEYYDPITTGDSSLSAVVQSVMAAEVGYHRMADHYFLTALYLDLLDLHHNTVDGIHVASTGGVWTMLVNGFGGLRDHGGRLSFDPRLPEGWPSLEFCLRWRGSRIKVRLTQTELELACDHSGVEVTVRGETVTLHPDRSTLVALAHQGPRYDEDLGEQPVVGGHRPDGTLLTAGVPSPSIPAEEAVELAGERVGGTID